MKRILLATLLALVIAFSAWAGEKLILTTNGFVVYGANPTEEEGRHVFKGHKFPRQCFVMAAYYMRQHPDLGAQLAHGTMTAWDGRLIAHAWVNLPSGKVFDGVEQEFFDRASYYAELNVREEAVYGYAEMMELVSKSQRFGPWKPTKGEYDYGAQRRPE